MWKDLTMSQRADVIQMAVKSGMRDLNQIRSFYDESIGSRRFDNGGKLPPYSAGRIASVLWKAPNQEYLGEPSHHYDFTQSEAWADAHGFYPDSRGHRDDRVKKPAHPSHPSKGTWSKDGKIFNLSDTGLRDPNYILFGLADGGQDPQAALMYNGAIVLPEITVTPKGNYYLNSYDNYKLSFANGGRMKITPRTTGGASYIPPLFTKIFKKKYRSLSGKVFDTREEAIKDNTDAKYGRGIYASKDIIHSVVKGDTLWDIAKANNTDVDTLRRLNPNIKGKGDLIHIGDKIKVGETSSPTLHDIREEWEKEKVLNTDNLKAIQGVKHKDNYVVVDKLNGILTVYDKNNQPLYSTSNISTGRSENDYNTITYVDKNGRIRSGAGNESTPAGITKITGTGVYHGFPSFTRGRHLGGDFEDIASSLHFGGTKDKKASNGCVRLDGQSLQDLSNFIGVGTDVYTLPEKKGSRFKVKDGKLSFVADNPYGEQSGDKRYWDDYNTYTDKSYSPLTIVDRKKSDDLTYSKNRKAYADAIANSKERLQQKFNMDSDTYNRLASLALGIAEQETKYGTSTRKAIKDLIPDFVLNTLRGNNNRSRGITQIKLHGDNREMQDVYSQLGITDESLDSPKNAAIATMARLSQMYNTEVLGRNFTGAEGVTIDPYDALLYKWMGRNSELSNHTATPELNNYINNVKKYQNDFGLYTMRANGGYLTIKKKEIINQRKVK